ncbi:MAG: helix-turn-helix transcriptional regulator, partial [Planctomycetes bacterium]|nr:helix-turn-helix transcriptional regulator [Planctomycetota bacterium]
MSKLSQMLNAKIEADGLNATSAAEKSGISFPSFVAALKGKSVPNSRSIDKYAAFLGVSVDDVRSASADADSPRGKGKAGRPAGKRGPGRPPGSGRGPG